MNKRGPKPKASFEDLYYLAEDFYRDFRRLKEGDTRVRIDAEHWQQIIDVMNQRVEQTGELPDDETREYFEGAAAQAAARFWTVKDPEVLRSLLKAKTAARVREICKDAYVIRQDLGGKKVLNWPLRKGSALPIYLSRFAEQFIAAKKNPRFPGKDRPSNELKRQWFLSRALAGAALGIETRTALNIVGATRPDEMLAQAHQAKRKRQRASKNKT